MFLILSYFPVALVRPIFKQMNNQVDCIITNVRGSPSSYYYKGREVSRLIGFIPPPNPVPIGIAISSLSGKVNITIKADKKIIADPYQFIEFVHEELESMTQEIVNKKDQ